MNAVEPALSVRGLTKVYGKRATLLRRNPHQHTAVDHVDLDVAPGKTLGLVGESGAGKSTVGRLVLRLIEADEGSIDFLGTDLRTTIQRKEQEVRSDDGKQRQRSQLGERRHRAV